jgi:hypothetical protein
MGFSRVVVDSASFGTYLRRLPLKPTGSAVRYFDGKQKANPNVYLAVVAMEIGKRDLQQCADAVMRLKAEYHYARKEYGKIHFNFLSDGKPHSFISYAKGDHSHPKFTKYLDYIFSALRLSVWNGPDFLGKNGLPFSSNETDRYRCTGTL